MFWVTKDSGDCSTSSRIKGKQKSFWPWRLAPFLRNILACSGVPPVYRKTFFLSFYVSDPSVVAVLRFIVKMASLTDWNLSLPVLQGALEKPPPQEKDTNWIWIGSTFFELNLEWIYEKNIVNLNRSCSSLWNLMWVTWQSLNLY